MRPIDDYSRSGVNSCVTSAEKPTVDNVDVACAMFSKLTWSLRAKNRDSTVLGRAFDLTAACRQLCVGTDSKGFAIIAVYDPGRKRSLIFRQVCLPFGAKASVNGFIRCSRCIQWLANVCLWIPATSYYDDFIVGSTSMLANNTDKAMGLLFTLLGWKYDLTGSKADVFSCTVSALGVCFDLSSTGCGTVRIANTDKRRADLDLKLAAILGNNALTMKEGLELRGRLSFAESQVLGKAGQYALKVLSEHIHAVPFRPHLLHHVHMALKFLRERLRNGMPRVISSPFDQCWCVYTDASFHCCDQGGLGGVLVSPTGSVVAWFGLLLDDKQIQPFLGAERKTCIGELETLAVPLALQMWSYYLGNAECVVHLDNEGARFVLIKGYSKSSCISRVCFQVATAIPKPPFPWGLGGSALGSESWNMQEQARVGNWSSQRAASWPFTPVPPPPSLPSSLSASGPQDSEILGRWASEEPEEPIRYNPTIPKLPAYEPKNAAIQFRDWVVSLAPAMASLRKGTPN